MCLVVFRKVTRHLDWRRNDNVQSELLSDRATNTILTLWAALGFELKYTWGVIHRSTQKACKCHRRKVINKVTTLNAPSVKLLTTRPFASHPVWPSTLQARSFDRLMRIDSHLVLEGALHGVVVMVHHPLPVVEFTFGQ